MNKRIVVIVLAIALLVISSFSQALAPKPDPSEQKNEDYFGRKYVDQFLNTEKSYEEKVIENGDPMNRVMVIPIEGVISSDDSGDYNHQRLLDAIDQVKTDNTIKAVLLKINTGGGAVYETAEFYDKLKAVKEERQIPIYASFGGVAASGGYYMAMLADKVFASNETTTGSIGVIMSGYNTQELMDKVGIKTQTIKSADMKDIMSMTREMTKEEKDVLQTYIDEAFNRFVNVVKQGRNMDEKKVRELADGRIYSGIQAKENGLVDEIGYWEDSLTALNKEANLEGPQVFEVTGSEKMFDSFMPSFFGSQLDKDAGQVNELLDRLERPEMSIEYRWEGGGY